jgi:hypothetical protein
LGIQSEKRVQARSFKWSLQKGHALLHQVPQEQSQFRHLPLQLTIDKARQSENNGILKEKAARCKRGLLCQTAGQTTAERFTPFGC